MSSWPYLHTIINHFPIILMVVGCAALALALVSRRRGQWHYALATLTLAGLSAYPAWQSGDEASDALRDTWYIVRQSVSDHAAAANWALASLLLLGAMSAYTWRRMFTRDRADSPPVRLRVVIAILAALTLAIVVRTAYLGGLIVHDSPRLVNPPGPSQAP